MANIRIKVESSKDNQVDAGQDSTFNEGTGKQTQEAKGKMATMGIFANQMLGVGKAALSFATSNIGTFTGDSVLQDNVNTMLGVVGDASSLIMGGIAGRAVGLAVAGISLATKYTFQAIDYAIQYNRAEKQSSYLRERTGGSTTEGSRTGGF